MFDGIQRDMGGTGVFPITDGGLPGSRLSPAIRQARLNAKAGIFTFFLDEQTGKANNMTRIEAFVDLIRNSKRRASA